MEYDIMNTKEMIEKYKPYNKQEQMDKEVILAFLRDNDDAYLRSNKIAHISASAWVTNNTFDKVLMAYHNIYNSWSWLGGHSDGDIDLLNVAIKEVKEESGLANVLAAYEGIFSIESLTVEGHTKNGVYVPCHLHLNVTFLLIADEEENLSIKVDENSDVAWFSLDEAVDSSSEEWFRDNIYIKLNNKLLDYKNNLK